MSGDHQEQNCCQNLHTKKIVKHGGSNIKLSCSFLRFEIDPICWIKENMDQNENVNILQNVLLPYAEENIPLKWTYQQDNDGTYGRI